MNRKMILIFTGALIGVLGVAFVLWPRHPKGYPGPAESVTLGITIYESSISVFIAEDRQFFKSNGLKVTMKDYDSGLRAVNGMLKGEVDIAYAVADYVLVGKVFNKENIQTIGSLDKVDWAFIIGRKDRGIATISDLKGKRIGLINGTIVEFFLGRFLELHGISLKEVTLVSVATFPQSVDAIVSGGIDAVISLPPYTDTMQDRLGANALVFPAQSGQLVHQLLICPNEWVAQHPSLTERFLKAMNQAEEFIIQHPENAKSIAKKKLSLSDDEVSKIWARNQFSLSLDQSLIAAMEDEARWIIRNELTSEKQVPDFLNYIYIDGLKAVKPEAVSIIP